MMMKAGQFKKVYFMGTLESILACDIIFHFKAKCWDNLKMSNVHSFGAHY